MGAWNKHKISRIGNILLQIDRLVQERCKSILVILQESQKLFIEFIIVHVPIGKELPASYQFR